MFKRNECIILVCGLFEYVQVQPPLIEYNVLLIEMILCKVYYHRVYYQHYFSMMFAICLISIYC